MQMINKFVIFGVKVMVVVCNVVNFVDINKVIGIFYIQRFLRGIIYVVGLVDFGVLIRLILDWCERVIVFKLYGVWFLYEVIKYLDLDIFVFYFFIFGVLGMLGFVNYVVVNIYFDVLVYLRCVQGLFVILVVYGILGN